MGRVIDDFFAYDVFSHEISEDDDIFGFTTYDFESEESDSEADITVDADETVRALNSRSFYFFSLLQNVGGFYFHLRTR